MQSLTIKRGSSFSSHAAYTSTAGQPDTLAGLSFKSQVRTPAGVLVDTLAVAVDEDGLGFTITATHGTTGWPTGPLVWDIKVTSGDVVTYTETVEIIVDARVTE